MHTLDLPNFQLQKKRMDLEVVEPAEAELAHLEQRLLQESAHANQGSPFVVPEAPHDEQPAAPPVVRLPAVSLTHVKKVADGVTFFACLLFLNLI